MKKTTNKNLELINGGTTVSGTLINAFTNIIKVLMESGNGLGSAIRRFVDGETCPLR